VDFQFLWGYSDIELDTFPQGAPAKNGTLSATAFLFHLPEGQVIGNQKWNKKPEVNVFVYRYDGRFYLGNSGAPVCYTGNNI
jgi:hypothetical protein